MQHFIYNILSKLPTELRDKDAIVLEFYEDY